MRDGDQTDKLARQLRQYGTSLQLEIAIRQASFEKHKIEEKQLQIRCQEELGQLKSW